MIQLYNNKIIMDIGEMSMDYKKIAAYIREVIDSGAVLLFHNICRQLILKGVDLTHWRIYREISRSCAKTTNFLVAIMEENGKKKYPIQRILLEYIGDIKIIKCLCRHIKDGTMLSLIIKTAIVANNPAIVLYLLGKRWKDIDILPIICDLCKWAARNGYRTIIKYALRCRDAMTTFIINEYILWPAYRGGHFNIVSKVMKARDDVELYLTDCNNIMIDVCNNGHLDILRFIIERVFCIDRETPEKYSNLLRRCLNVAYNNGRVNIIEYLLSLTQRYDITSSIDYGMLLISICEHCDDDAIIPYINGIYDKITDDNIIHQAFIAACKHGRNYKIVESLLPRQKVNCEFLRDLLYNRYSNPDIYDLLRCRVILSDETVNEWLSDVDVRDCNRKILFTILSSEIFDINTFFDRMHAMKSIETVGVLLENFSQSIDIYSDRHSGKFFVGNDNFQSTIWYYCDIALAKVILREYTATKWDSGGGDNSIFLLRSLLDRGDVAIIDLLYDRDDRRYHSIGILEFVKDYNNEIFRKACYSGNIAMIQLLISQYRDIISRTVIDYKMYNTKSVEITDILHSILPSSKSFINTLMIFLYINRAVDVMEFYWEKYHDIIKFDEKYIKFMPIDERSAIIALSFIWRVSDRLNKDRLFRKNDITVDKFKWACHDGRRNIAGLLYTYARMCNHTPRISSIAEFKELFNYVCENQYGDIIKFLLERFISLYSFNDPEAAVAIIKNYHIIGKYVSSKHGEVFHNIIRRRDRTTAELWIRNAVPIDGDYFMKHWVILTIIRNDWYKYMKLLLRNFQKLTGMKRFRYDLGEMMKKLVDLGDDDGGNVVKYFEYFHYNYIGKYRKKIFSDDVDICLYKACLMKNTSLIEWIRDRYPDAKIPQTKIRKIFIHISRCWNKLSTIIHYHGFQEIFDYAYNKNVMPTMLRHLFGIKMDDTDAWHIIFLQYLLSPSNSVNDRRIVKWVVDKAIDDDNMEAIWYLKSKLIELLLSSDDKNNIIMLFTELFIGHKNGHVLEIMQKMFDTLYLYECGVNKSDWISICCRTWPAGDLRRFFNDLLYRQLAFNNVNVVIDIVQRFGRKYIDPFYIGGKHILALSVIWENKKLYRTILREFCRDRHDYRDIITSICRNRQISADIGIYVISQILKFYNLEYGEWIFSSMLRFYRLDLVIQIPNILNADIIQSYCESLLRRQKSGDDDVATTNISIIGFLIRNFIAVNKPSYIEQYANDIDSDEYAKLMELIEYNARLSRKIALSSRDRQNIAVDIGEKKDCLGCDLVRLILGGGITIMDWRLI